MRLQGTNPSREPKLWANPAYRIPQAAKLLGFLHNILRTKMYFISVVVLNSLTVFGGGCVRYERRGSGIDCDRIQMNWDYFM